MALGEYSIYDINNPKVLGRSSFDAGLKGSAGSYSYGIAGMNTQGSLQNFLKVHGKKLGLPTGQSRSYYESKEFRDLFNKKAYENPEAMKEAQSDFVYNHYFPQALGGKTTKEYLKSIRNDPKFYNNLGLNVMLADMTIQAPQMTPPRLKKFVQSTNLTDPETIIKEFTEYNKQFISGDFRSALRNSSASTAGLIRRNKKVFIFISSLVNPYS